MAGGLRAEDAAQDLRACAGIGRKPDRSVLLFECQGQCGADMLRIKRAVALRIAPDRAVGPAELIAVMTIAKRIVAHAAKSGDLGGSVVVEPLRGVAERRRAIGIALARGKAVAQSGHEEIPCFLPPTDRQVLFRGLTCAHLAAPRRFARDKGKGKIRIQRNAAKPNFCNFVARCLGALDGVEGTGDPEAA